MPKPNPGNIFQKEGIDLAATHLTEQGISMMHRSAENERQLQQILYNEESTGHATAGADRVLRQLSRTQRNLMNQQERKRDKVRAIVVGGLQRPVLCIRWRKKFCRCHLNMTHLLDMHATIFINSSLQKCESIVFSTMDAFY